MRPTARFDEKRLKYYREAHDWTQAYMASQVQLTLRSYQRLEQTGQTSPTTLARLAKVLDVDVEAIAPTAELDRFKPAIDFVWIEGHADWPGGRLCNLHAGLQKMRAWLQEVDPVLLGDNASNDADSSCLKVSLDADCLVMRLKRPDKVGNGLTPVWETFLLRPAVQHKGGIQWKRFTSIELEWLIQPSVLEGAFNHADFIEFNGLRVPPTDNCAFAISACEYLSSELPCFGHEPGPPEPNTQIVSNIRDVLRLVRGLDKKLNQGQDLTPHLKCIANSDIGLEITRLPGRLSSRTMKVWCVHMEGPDTFRRAPWSLASRKQVAEAIEEGQVGIGIFDPSPAPQWQPNMLLSQALIT